MTQVVVREALSPQERYADELERLLTHIGRLDEQAVQRALNLLADTRRKILEAIATAPAETYLDHHNRLLSEIDSLIAAYVERYERFMTAQAKQFWTLGADVVNLPLAAAGVSIRLPSLEPRLIDILQDFHPRLIDNIAVPALSQITRELQLVLLGVKTPFAVQGVVLELLRTQPDRLDMRHGIPAQAETLTRTTVNQVLNLATRSRQEQLQQRVAEVFPEVSPRKQWLNAGDGRVRDSHKRRSLLDQRPAIDEDFVLTDDQGISHRAKGPHDPRLPVGLLVNCRCRSVISVESLLPVLEGA